MRPSRLNIMVIYPEHPKWDQNLKFTPPSETTSIPAPFICEFPFPPPGLQLSVCQVSCRVIHYYWPKISYFHTLPIVSSSWKPELSPLHGWGEGGRGMICWQPKIVSLKIVASASWKENISLSLITRSVYKDYWPTPSQKSRGYSEMCTFSNYSRLFNGLTVFWKKISMTNASHFSQWVKKYRILRRNHVISAGRSSRRRLADSFLPINVA